jgi:hypothetical protein
MAVKPRKGAQKSRFERAAPRRAIRKKSARFENCAVSKGGNDIRFSPDMDVREMGSDAIVLVDHISPISLPPHRW